MFGCIGKIVVLALLIIVGALAFVTRGVWEPRLREKMGWRPAATAAAPAWEPVTAAGAERVRTALAGMRRPSGPAFVNVKAGDLVAFALDAVLRGWGSGASSANGAEALAGENTISIRATIHMKDLGGAGSLGPLAGVLEGDQPIEVRGRLEFTAGARAQYRVERIALKNLVLPSAAIGAVVQRLAPRKDKAQETTAIALVLPSEIADIRVTPGRVTLYKAAR
jgi:hypothetical protein